MLPVGIKVLVVGDCAPASEATRPAVSRIEVRNKGEVLTFTSPSAGTVQVGGAHSPECATLHSGDQGPSLEEGPCLVRAENEFVGF